MKKDPIFRPVSLEEMLLCREKRAEQQKEILRRFSSPVISFTMNVPGPIKISPLIERGFFFGMNEIRRKLSEQNVLFSACHREATGCDALFAVDLPAETAKKICQTVEEETAVGRLFDLDVIGTNGEKLCRTEERCCIVCGKKGRACSASRAHGVPELWDKVQTVLSCHFRSADPRAIAKIAVQALKDEVLTTPKPGLVDQRNNGSHKDMSVPLFLS
ncbi:MAG: citrate lyase holo-[Clostridia bacterium]|nr:citrate lyase holo-[acyl-carrier protein] synthase [Clostridia bacterium]